MSQRYTCMICRNEIAHLGAECPYCKGRYVIAEGASPRMLAFVLAVMVGVFALTGIYARSFKAESRGRGRLHFEAAESKMSEGLYDEAIERYRDALLYSRDDPTYRLGLAQALFAARRYSETEIYLVGLRVGDPTSGIVNHLLAQLAARDGRIDEAVSYYRNAVHGDWRADADETRLRLLLELVDLLEESGRTQLLTAALLELTDGGHDDPAVSRRLASLLLETEVYDRASSIYASLLASDSKDRSAHLGRAEAEFHLGNYLTAQKHYQETQRYGADKSTEARIDLCERIIELDPTGRGIELAARFDRSRLLVERARAAFMTCNNPSGADLKGPLPPNQAAVMGRADESLNARRPRASDAAVESNILLAEEFWDLATFRCQPSDPPDEPLRHVLAKLAR